MVAIMLGADNGFFYTSQVMHFSSPFTVFLIYHKQCELIDKAARTVHYAGKDSIVGAVDKVYPMAIDCFTTVSEEEELAEKPAETTDAQLQQGIKDAENPNASAKKASPQESPTAVPDQNRPENQSQKKAQEHKRALRRCSHEPKKSSKA